MSKPVYVIQQPDRTWRIKVKGVYLDRRPYQPGDYLIALGYAEWVAREIARETRRHPMVVTRWLKEEN